MVEMRTFESKTSNLFYLIIGGSALVGGVVLALTGGSVVLGTVILVATVNHLTPHLGYVWVKREEAAGNVMDDRGPYVAVER